MRLPFPSSQYGRRYGQGAPMFRRASGQGGMGSAIKMRLLIALAIALFAVISYYAKPGDLNEVTGESERVALTEEADEVQLGLQAAPEMVGMHGGPSRSFADQERVNRIGWELLEALDRYLKGEGRRNPYLDSFQFTLLADARTVNAFALPGGPVFITEALYRQLETDGQLAGVLGHEIGHVLSRHGNKQMARQGLFQGLAGAIGVLGGDVNSARMGQMIAATVSMKYGREAEIESDDWAVRLTSMANYNPEAMIKVMEVLEAAGGGGGQPEFFSTHPKPENRAHYIEEAIKRMFPNGVPPGMRP